MNLVYLYTTVGNMKNYKNESSCHNSFIIIIGLPQVGLNNTLYSICS